MRGVPYRPAHPRRLGPVSAAVCPGPRDLRNRTRARGRRERPERRPAGRGRVHHAVRKLRDVPLWARGAVRAVLCSQPAERHLYDGRTRLFDGDGEPVWMYSMGGLSELAVIPERGLAGLPDELELVDSAIFGCALMTAYGAVAEVGRLKPGESVAVFGAGGVGGSVVQMARALGAGTDPRDRRRRRQARLGALTGATDTINARTDDAVAVARELTDGAGVDVAFEAIGRPETFRQTVEVVADGGRCVMVGIAPVGLTAEVEITRLVRRKLQILGSFGGRPRHDLPALMDWPSTDSSSWTARSANGSRWTRPMRRTHGWPTGRSPAAPSSRCSRQHAGRHGVGLRASGRPSAEDRVKSGVAGHSGAGAGQRAMSGPARQIRRRLAPGLHGDNCNSLRSFRSNSQSFGTAPPRCRAPIPFRALRPPAPRAGVGRDRDRVAGWADPRDPAATPRPSAPRPAPREGETASTPSIGVALRTKLGELAAHAEAWRFRPRIWG